MNCGACLDENTSDATKGLIMKLLVNMRPYIVRIGLMLLILAMGAYFRFGGLFKWDEPSFRLHPDERFLTEVASQIRLPNSLTQYFDSSSTPLNPRNGNYKFFVYGMLPHELTRLTAVVLTPPERLPPPNENAAPNGEYDISSAFPTALRELINPDGINYTSDIHRVGRAWSAIFDLLSILLIFLIARRLYGERVAFGAAFMAAGTAVLIQQSHFFTVDAASAFFILLTIYYAIRIVEKGSFGAYVGAAVGIGAAIASRITLATVAFVVIVAVGARLYRAYVANHQRQLWREALMLVICGVMSLFVARTLGPDMFAGTMPNSMPQMILTSHLGNSFTPLDVFFQGKGYFDIRPDDRFLQSMNDIARFASGEVDWPPTQQWAARPRYVFAWNNMVWAGMGAPLGIAAWLGFVVAGWQLIRRKQLVHLIPWAWVAFFFGWQGGQFLMTMRYYLPIYGVLIIFASWLVMHIASQRALLFDKVMNWLWRPGDPELHRPRALALGRSLAFMAVVPAIVVLTGAVSWGYAFSRIYTEEHTRVAASRWIYANIPPGSAISSELWDDGLPLGLDGRSADEYEGIAFAVYAEDEYSKYYGNPDSGDMGFIGQLEKVEYIIMSSNRVYDTAGRLVMRYPALINYYKALFDGSLGFELVAEFRSSPRLFGIEVPTAVWAEEAFSVYDHPRVLIFKKTDAFTQAKAEELILKDVAFGEVYKMPTMRASKVMTALHFTDLQWPTYRNSASWNELFSDFTTTQLPWLWWILALELIGLAGFVLLQRWLAALPDRGFAIAKTLSLVIIAWLIWLTASINVLHFDRWGIGVLCALWVGAAGVVWWRNRVAWRRWWREVRWLVLTAQGLFLVAYAAFVVIRAANPDLWHPARGGEKPMDLAFLTAVVRSPSFPPYDPWFAGGMLNYYYFGFVMVGVLIHLTGIEPSIAYNLAVPTMFALTAVASWGVALALQGRFPTTYANRWRWWWRALSVDGRRKLVAAVLAALFVVVAGNWSQALWYLPGTGDATVACDKGTSYAMVEECKGRMEWAFWDATRVVSIKTGDGVINEFPFFTFLFADLHAHMIGLPLLVAGLGVMLSLIARKRLPSAVWPRWRGRIAAIVLLGLLSGVAYATNTWDYPTIVGMSVLTMALIAWRDQQHRAHAWHHIIGFGAAVAGILLVSQVASWPFTRAFASDYTGFDVWQGPRTPTALFLELSGMWMYAAISAVVLFVIRLRWLSVVSALLVGTVAVGGFAIGVGAAWPALWLEIAIIIGIGVLLLLLLQRNHLWQVPTIGRRKVVQLELPVFADLQRPQATSPAIALETLFTIIMVLAVVGISALTEVLVAKGDIGRMNSVFKFGMQVWVFGGLSAAVLLGWTWQRIWRYPIGIQVVWRTLTIVLVAASFAYPVTATPVRIDERYEKDAPLSLDGETYISSEIATWSENGYNFTLVEDAAGIAWLREHVQGTPIILEAHAEAYRWVARISTHTGLPTIIGWPWHQTQQRSVADVGPVLTARQEAVKRWYTSDDAEKTFAEIQKYGIEYVYVGQMERAMYGESVGIAFVTLAERGKITPVFRDGGTVIYQVPPSGTMPAVLKTGTLARFAPQPLPQQSLLPVYVGDLAEVAAPGWNPLRHDVGVSVLWLLAWYLIALFGLIPAMWLGERQWPWARLIGIIILGYALWLPVSARLMYNGTIGLAVATLLVVLGNLWALMMIGLRTRPVAGAPLIWFESARMGEYLAAGWQSVITSLRTQRRAIIGFELLFTTAFLFIVVVRMANPDVWHPFWGGEKPFEFGILNAVLRSPVMPPYSPFFSDGTLNYYYYGYVLLSLPLRFTGIAPEIGYNLIVATLYALVVSATAVLTWHITRRHWVWVVAVLVMAVLGNPAVAFPVGWSRGVAEIWQLWQNPDTTSLWLAMGDWFIGSSRVIPNTINEYPAWSFVFGDLHAHVISMPITLLFLALAWQALQPGVLPFVWWPLVALVMGALATTNSWDAPTAVLLMTGVLARRALLRGGWRYVPLAILQSAVVAGVAYVSYLPFFQQYVPQIGGVQFVKAASPWIPWMAMWGIFVIPTVMSAAVLAWRHKTMQIVVAGVLVIVMAVGITLDALDPAILPVLQQWIADPRIWLGLMVVILVPFVLGRQPDQQRWFGIWLVLIAWAVALGVEIIYVRDHMEDGDWYRMNTVFKFGIQSWLLLTIGVACVMPILWEHIQRWPYRLAHVVGVVFTVPLVLGAVYPLFGIPNRMSYRVVADQAPTLDGLRFMEKGSYSTYDRSIEFVSDYRAIQWLNENVTGTPVIMHSSIEFYRGYGVRIAANTGFPTVVSPLHESEQRNGDIVGKRDADVIEFYRSTDLTKKRQLLSRYRVAYVIVGPIERAAYGKEGVELISEMPDVRQVFQAGETTIYRVSPQIISIPPLDAVDGSRSEQSVSVPTEPEPEPEYVDPETLRKAYEDDPTNITNMMQLVDAYRRVGKSIEASDVLLQTSELVPNDIMVLHVLGDISVEARLNDRAIKAYKAAIAVNNNPGNINKLLSGYMLMGMYEEALAETNKAMADYPDAYDFYFTRGKIYEMLGEIDAARSDFQTYLEVTPEDAIFRKDVMDALDRLER
ncbi:MAG: hypothetical protein FJ040_03980 [Chloroflexi bacterium]|nr:hypothetical protein [Chloroflexota bacterium]